MRKNLTISVIQVYAPTNISEQDEKDAFYSLLTDTCTNEKGYYRIIMGDFNAKIGKDIDYSKTVGKFSSRDETNDNGEKLIEFVEGNELNEANTIYKKKLSKKWTWQSPDKATKNEIDYFLTKDLSIIKDVEQLKSFEFPSDHRAIQMTVKIPKRVKVKNWAKTILVIGHLALFFIFTP